eukprot:scaffold129234_cov51-Phaeocystis_antarctica.AAC.2
MQRLTSEEAKPSSFLAGQPLPGRPVGRGWPTLGPGLRPASALQPLGPRWYWLCFRRHRYIGHMFRVRNWHLLLLLLTYYYYYDRYPAPPGPETDAAAARLEELKRQYPERAAALYAESDVPGGEPKK